MANTADLYPNDPYGADDFSRPNGRSQSSGDIGAGVAGQRAVPGDRCALKVGSPLAPLGAVWDAELAGAHLVLMELAACYEPVLTAGNVPVAVIKDLQIFTIVSPASAVGAGYHSAIPHLEPGVLDELSHPISSQRASGQALRVDVSLFAIAATLADASSEDNKAYENEFGGPSDSRCPLRPLIGREFRQFANSEKGPRHSLRNFNAR